MPYKTKYFLNALFQFVFFSRYFEFWIPGYCKRNAFIKLNLSPYLHLKRDTENYIKYIDFYTNKIAQSWQINYKQLLSSSPPYSSYICACICASSPERVNLPLPASTQFTKWMSSLLFFFDSQWGLAYFMWAQWMQVPKYPTDPRITESF